MSDIEINPPLVKVSQTYEVLVQANSVSHRQLQMVKISTGVPVSKRDPQVYHIMQAGR